MPQPGIHPLRSLHILDDAAIETKQRDTVLHCVTLCTVAAGI